MYHQPIEETISNIKILSDEMARLPLGIKQNFDLEEFNVSQSSSNSNNYNISKTKTKKYNDSKKITPKPTKKSINTNSEFQNNVNNLDKNQLMIQNNNSQSGKLFKKKIQI